MASLGDTVSDGTVRQQTSDEDFFALQERHRDSDCDCVPGSLSELAGDVSGVVFF
jgi:hypothetical protein